MSDKQKAAALKEGGKKAQDLAGLEAMGGVAFFTVSFNNTLPELIDVALEGMNAQVDESAAERKGGADKLGKLILCADQKKFTFRCHVPKALAEEKGVTAEEWVTEVLKRAVLSVDIEKKSDELVAGEVDFDADAGRFPEKIRDAFLSHSFPFLRAKGLIPEDDDDDFICDADAAGIGSW